MPDAPRTYPGPFATRTTRGKLEPYGSQSSMLRTAAPPSRTYVLAADQAEFNGRIRLWLAGFANQSVVTVDEVVACVARIPMAHLEGLKGIIFDRERVTQELIAHPAGWSFTIKGVFFQEERCVVLYEFDTRARFEHILYHEIGHYVFYHVLGGTLKKRWVTELYPDSHHVSAIAARNASEDFAESYAAFAADSKKLLPVPRKHAFMRAEVFRA